MRHPVFLALILTLMAGFAQAEEPVFRVGVLKFGTVNWELAVIAHHGLDAKEGLHIEQVELASNPATQIALQAGRVDAAVSDWLFVSRQRAEGADWSFFPFSTALGSVVLPPGSSIKSLADLKGKRLGIAGSTIDKSWLILRLLGKTRDGIDLDRDTTKFFAPPPLLEEQLKAGRLDAVLTFWPSAARLEAEGYHRLLPVEDALHALGFPARLPLVGYIVSEKWAKAHQPLVAAFQRARAAADAILASSDAEWDWLAPRTEARDKAELTRLRDAFRAGIPARWGDDERHDSARLYDLLAKEGGSELVGPGQSLQPGTFLDFIRY